MPRIRIHLHAQGRVRTIDLGPSSLKQQYEQLVAELMKHLAKTEDSIKRAAGVLFVSPRGRVLLLKRARTSQDHPGAWGLPAGAVEPGESDQEAARREVYEEIGNRCPGPLIKVAEIESGARLFTAFAQQANVEFDARLNHEHVAWGWFDPDDLPTPIHPGLNRILDLVAAPTHDKAPCCVVKLSDEASTAGPPEKTVLELFSSGREFTVEELQKITGVKLKHQLLSAFAELRKGDGLLRVAKQPGGTYKVIPRSDAVSPLDGADPLPAPEKSQEAPIPAVPALSETKPAVEDPGLADHVTPHTHDEDQNG